MDMQRIQEIVEWDFSRAINQRYDYRVERPYFVDRWRWCWVPEIVRRWQEWKQRRDEWAEFLRSQSLPERRTAFNGA